MTKTKRLILWVIALVILAGTIALTKLIMNKPEVPKKPIAENFSVVEALRVTLSDQPVYIKVTGKIEPAQEIQLTSQVSGRITYVNKNFIPGGFIKKGETLVRLEDTDYKIALKQAEASLNEAKASYKQAEGRSKQAASELEMYEKNFGKKVDDNYLALHKPDLEQAKANLMKAELQYNKAKVALDRTNITAPFNSIIKDINVTNGSMLGSGVKLAILVNTDRYWINTAIPIGNLKYVDFTENTEATLISNDGDKMKEANFLKLANYLDDTTHFMGVLFVVSDPLGLNSKDKSNVPLYLGDYLKVIIKGKTLKQVAKIPLYLVKQDDQDRNVVYKVKNNMLDIEPIDVLYQDNDYAYIRGLSDGDLLITSDLPVIVNKMPVKIKKEI